jgi:hypothetical protein
VLCRISDSRFQDRGDTARLLAMLAVADAEKHLAKSALLWAVGESSITAGVESLAAELKDFAVRELAIGAAVWQAFARVCTDEMGLEPRTVVAANHGPKFVALHAGDFDRLDAAEPDQAALAGWRELYIRKWREGTGHLGN